MKRFGSFALLVAFALAGCSSGIGPGPGLPGAPTGPGNPGMPSTQLGKYIKHVVLIIQENRSFDNLFANFPGTGTVRCGMTSTGACIPLTPITFQDTFDGYKDLDHDYLPARTAWDNGKMDKFDLNHLGTTGAGPLAGAIPYSYIVHSQVKPYWDMAKQYVLADRMFPVMFGPSWTAHQDLIAGTTTIAPGRTLVDFPINPKTGSIVLPWGCDAPKGSATVVVNPANVESPTGPFPCLTQYRTLAYTLDRAHVSWKYYAPPINSPDFAGAVWTAFDAIRFVRYGSDWTRNIINPQTQVLSDIQNGNLPAMSWVIPDQKDSDHPLGESSSGPSWVATIVNAIGESKYWNSTAIIVVWDDWGGFYDNVPPPQKSSFGLGIRVPALFISPYAKKGYVSHTVYEFGSILKFVEQAFGLPYLGGTSDDRRSNSIVDSFDFTQKPRKFVKIPVPEQYNVQYFLHEKPSMVPPDPD